MAAFKHLVMSEAFKHLVMSEELLSGVKQVGSGEWSNNNISSFSECTDHSCSE